MTAVKSYFPWLVVGFVLLVYGYHFADVPFFQVESGAGIEGAYRLASEGILGSFAASHNVHPPVFNILLGLVFKGAGYGIASAKLMTFGIALLVVLFTFLVLRHLFGRDHFPIWQVVLGVKLIPVFYIASKTLRPDILMTLWMILSYYFLIRWRSDQRKGWLMLGAVVNGLMFMTQMYGMPIIMVWIVEWVRRRDWRSGLFSLGLMGVVMMPYLGWVVANWQSVDISYDVTHWLMRSKMYLGSRTNALILVSLLAGLFFWWRRDKAPHQDATHQDASHKNAAYQNAAKEDVAIVAATYLSQFMMLPAPNELYVVALIPFLMVVGNGLRVRADKLTKAALILFVLINTLGLFIYILKYRAYEYESYAKTIHDVAAVSGVGYVLGSDSVAPLFRDASFQTLNSIDRMSDSLFRQLVNGASTIVVQPAMESMMTPRQRAYLQANRRLVKSVLVPDYSTKGKKRLNLIKIYQ